MSDSVLDSLKKWFDDPENVRKFQEDMIKENNRKKGEFVTCHLEFKYNSYSTDYKYTVGYKPRNYVNYYHCCYSSESYEQALMNLYYDMEIKKMLNKNIK